MSAAKTISCRVDYLPEKPIKIKRAKAAGPKPDASQVGDVVPERMDIRTIARLADVSIATVSRTINGVSTVNPKMAKRVWDVIERLDYVPNTQARALVSGRSKIFGLLISEITNPFFPELIQGFEDIAVDSGYEILISSTNYDPQRMSYCIRRMLERKVEGVAVMTFGIEEPLLEQLAKRKIPLVFVDVGPDRPGVSVLRVDYQHGIRQGVQHLAALGHRRIAFVTGPIRLHSAQSRLTAFFNSMQECGITPHPDWIVQGDHTLEGGVAAMGSLLAGKEMPTAVMCSNDMTAIGVLHKSYRAGLRVPDDLSVIGFDDIHIAQVTMPPLTTIQMSRYTLAKAAFAALRAHVEQPGQSSGRQEFDIPTELVVRESTSYPQGTMAHLKTKR
ncbi:LacI family DNA-binding transcriptional regulator [Acidicapsa ligni]|uniref:LacI family DNA-binding transcriptional regulator n=1 Tax=Acidicapsa ligni TaxID=542300 RepID=UPI00295B62A4|nr:LacI family DNA-binding transcriptional regulator [Acidicapsa ligni]